MENVSTILGANVNKTRECYWDYIRIFAMFCVIGVHAVGSIEVYSSSNTGDLLVEFLNRINSIGVPLFFGLSGIMLLDDSGESFKEFYTKRAIRIVIPYMIYSAIYVVYYVGIEQGNIKKIPIEYIIRLITGNVHPTHWFVYVIIGLYFATPFLRKMFANMDYRQIEILLYSCIIFMLINELTKPFNLEFGIHSIVFSDEYLCSYISGYCINKISDESKMIIGIKKCKWLLLFVAGMFYILTMNAFLGYIFVLLILLKSRSTEKETCSIVTIMSKYSYSVYLLHAAIVSLILKIHTNWSNGFEIKCVLICFAVYIITFIAVWCIDNTITNRLIKVIRNAIIYELS